MDAQAGNDLIQVETGVGARAWVSSCATLEGSAICVCRPVRAGGEDRRGCAVSSAFQAFSHIEAAISDDWIAGARSRYGRTSWASGHVNTTTGVAPDSWPAHFHAAARCQHGWNLECRGTDRKS